VTQQNPLSFRNELRTVLWPISTEITFALVAAAVRYLICTNTTMDFDDFEILESALPQALPQMVDFTIELPTISPARKREYALVEDLDDGYDVNEVSLACVVYMFILFPKRKGVTGVEDDGGGERLTF
jgi:hypothetical protein